MWTVSFVPAPPMLMPRGKSNERDGPSHAAGQRLGHSSRLTPNPRPDLYQSSRRHTSFRSGAEVAAVLKATASPSGPLMTARVGVGGGGKGSTSFA